MNNVNGLSLAEICFGKTCLSNPPVTDRENREASSACDDSGRGIKKGFWHWVERWAMRRAETNRRLKIPSHFNVEK